MVTASAVRLRQLVFLKREKFWTFGISGTCKLRTFDPSGVQEHFGVIRCTSDFFFKDAILKVLPLLRLRLF